MSLQVKLRHPLGERLIELEPRSANDPVVIGRQLGAQIQIPSVSVSPRHSVMFVYEGRWVVQDSGETTGTFVNGQAIEGAVFLQIGDVIKLGAEPRSPTIEIDPQAVAEGRTGYAMAAPGAVRTVASPPQRPAAARSLGGRIPTTGYAPPAGYPPQQSAYGATAVATPVAQALDEGANPDDIAWPTESSATGTPTGRLSRAPAKRSDAPMYIAVGVGILIVGIMIWALFGRSEESPQKVIEKKVGPFATVDPTRKAVKDDHHASGSIFDEGLVDRSGANNSAAPPSAKALPVITGNPVELAIAFGPGKRSTAALPIPKSADGKADDSSKPPAPVIDPDDKRFKDKEWVNLDTMRWGPDRLKALLAYEDYEHDHAGQLTAQVNLLREATLDLLWFDRIEKLWNKREQSAGEIKKIDQELKDEPNEVFRNGTLVPAKQAEQKKMNAVNDLVVKEMGYTADHPPDLTDDAQLDELRKLRDRDYYAQWKKRIVNSVHRQRALPWVD